MADEEINQEGQEEQPVDQEELAKQWEEQLAQQSASKTPDVDEMLESQQTAKEETEESVDQEELAKQWEEQLAQQSANETPDVDEILESQQTAKEETEESVDQEELAKQWEEALSQQESTESVDESVNQEDLAKQWEETLGKQESASSTSSLSVGNDKLDLILDIPLEISVEIGSKSIPLEDILKMTPNTIIELERYIDQPVDIKVNGKLVAKGELYTVENNFGVKITSIITVQERMRLLMEEVE